MNGKNLTKLGTTTNYVFDAPDSNILETFKNTNQSTLCLVPFYQTRDEFTSICVSGDTLIDTARDENKYPLGIPIKDLVDTEGFVFGFDTESFKPVVKKYHSVRKTQKNAKVFKIEMEAFHSDGNGNVTKETKQLITTPEHPILISNGWHKTKWTLAKNLKQGMRLIADQKTKDVIRGEARHRLIKEAVLGRKLKKGELVHHKDHEHFNNTPSNLKISNSSKHFSHHQTERYASTLKLPSISKLVYMYNSGRYNITSLAKKYNCDDSTINSRIGHLVKKRTQSESLKAKPSGVQLRTKMRECAILYKKGYTIYELASFYKKHSTTILTWIREGKEKIRTSLETKMLRKSICLPSLNHKIISVTPYEKQDVFNLEVEDIENFFANGVVVHNCPVTSQPDHAKIEILYVPNKLMVESKSLKLYLFSFRNHGEFHEEVVHRISRNLWNLLDPKYLRIFGDFAPRGGIAIAPLLERWERIDFQDPKITKHIKRLVNAWDMKHAK